MKYHTTSGARCSPPALVHPSDGWQVSGRRIRRWLQLTNGAPLLRMQGQDLDAALSQQQRAEVFAFSTMIERQLLDAMARAHTPFLFPPPGACGTCTGPTVQPCPVLGLVGSEILKPPPVWYASAALRLVHGRR